MQKSRGFTLIELLVVIAIIGILASVVLASLNSAREKSRDARRISDVKQLQLALELFFDASSTYPVGSTLSGVLDPLYIASVSNDPLGVAYIYQGIDTSGTDCAGVETCTSYVLRADLEDAGHNALNNDLDGTVVGVDCADAPSGFYCIQP